MNQKKPDHPRVSVEEYLQTEDFPSLEELRKMDSENIEDFDPGITSAEGGEVSERGKQYLRNHRQDAPKQLPTFDQLLDKAEQLLSKEEKDNLQPYPIDFGAARELFWHIYKRKVGSNPVLDGNLKEQIRGLILYFIGHPNSPFPGSKGIYLFGDVGVGKTGMLEAFSVFTQTLNYKYFRISNVRDISFRIQRRKDTSLMDSFITGNWCFDDLFADQEESKIYGNATDVSKVLIEQFYIHGWRQGKKIHVTSNIEPEEVQKQISDPRFVDRVREMMTPIELIGKSKRQ